MTGIMSGAYIRVRIRIPTCILKNTSNHDLDSSGVTRYPQKQIGGLYILTSHKKPEAYRIPESFEKKFQIAKNVHSVIFESNSFRPTSHGNAIVPFHLRSSFWKGQIGCSLGKGTIACQFFFLFRQERNRSIEISSICLFRWERNGTVACRSTFRIASLAVPFFGTERSYLSVPV